VGTLDAVGGGRKKNVARAGRRMVPSLPAN